MIVAANPLIDLQAGLMIWTLICFGITFYVLKRFAFGPIQQAIDQRRDRIRESLAEADRAREDARKLLEEHKQLRASARGEAEEILSEARRIADSMQERTRAEIEEDRERRLEETKRQIEAETARSIETIRSEVADLAITAAEKVTRKSLDDGDHRRLIEEAIGDLDFSALERQEATR